MEGPGGPVICHVDQAVDPDAALRVAESLAARLGRELLLFVAVPQSSPVPGLPDDVREELVRADGKEALAAAAGALDGDVTTIERMEAGVPGSRLAALAAEEQAPVVVVSSGGHGPLRAHVLGRPHVELAAAGPCPVVVVPATLGEHGSVGGPIVCGVNGSEQSLAAARFAVGLAQALLAELLLVPVAPAATARLRPDMPTSRRALEQTLSLLPRRLEAAFAIERGKPAEQLVSVASRCGAELIVVGGRGVGPLRAALFGSVSGKLVAEASVPVGIVPPPLRREPQRVGMLRTMSADRKYL